MTTPGPAGSAHTSPERPRPRLDLLAVLAAMQQQLDDLTEVVEAQQRTLQQVLAAIAPATPGAAARTQSGGR